MMSQQVNRKSWIFDQHLRLSVETVQDLTIDNPSIFKNNLDSSIDNPRFSSHNPSFSTLLVIWRMKTLGSSWQSIIPSFSTWICPNLGLSIRKTWITHFDKPRFSIYCSLHVENLGFYQYDNPRLFNSLLKILDYQFENPRVILPLLAHLMRRKTKIGQLIIQFIDLRGYLSSR